MAKPKRALESDSSTTNQVQRKLRSAATATGSQNAPNPSSLVSKENGGPKEGGNRKRKIAVVVPFVAEPKDSRTAFGDSNGANAKRPKEAMKKRTSKNKPTGRKLKILRTDNKDQQLNICLTIPELPSFNNSKVLTVGNGEVGQLGLGSDIMEKSRPFFVAEIKEPVVDIAAGGMHSVCLTNSGKVYTFGCNDDGTLGRITEEEEDGFVPGLVDLPEKAVRISAGDTHSAALTESGKVFIWGNFRDSRGLMGLTADGQKQPTPLRILQSIPVVALASGAEHLVCLGTNGQIYTMGSPEQGQLGRIPPYFNDRGGRKGLEYILTPDMVRLQRVKDPTTGQQPEFDRVWTGVYCTFARERHSGSIYGFGLNNYNQLGEEEFIKFMPTPLLSFKGHNWEMISGGMHHTIALDREGKVFTWGRKEYGRLGLGESIENDETKPAPVPDLQNIKCVHVGCGTSTTYAVSEDGQMYSWGFGESNQLGHGNQDDVFVPKIVQSKNMNACKAVKVVGGGQHTLILAMLREA